MSPPPLRAAALLSALARGSDAPARRVRKFFAGLFSPEAPADTRSLQAAVTAAGGAPQGPPIASERPNFAVAVAERDGAQDTATNARNEVLYGRLARRGVDMSGQSRRTFIASTAATALAAYSLDAPTQPRDELQPWLAAHAVPVRSIDAADEDFSDLDPLIGAIGSSRVVQLGVSQVFYSASYTTTAYPLRWEGRVPALPIQQN